MLSKSGAHEWRCKACASSFTSWRRLQHHRAAEHALKTSDDIHRRATVRKLTELKGLQDIKTVISTHYRSASRHKGTPYQEILSMGMDKLRLETELAQITKRQSRVVKRLDEIRQHMGKRLTQVREDPPRTPLSDESRVDNRAAPGGRPMPPNLRRMTVEY